MLTKLTTGLCVHYLGTNKIFSHCESLFYCCDNKTAAFNSKTVSLSYSRKTFLLHNYEQWVVIYRFKNSYFIDLERLHLEQQASTYFLLFHPHVTPLTCVRFLQCIHFTYVRRYRKIIIFAVDIIKIFLEEI